MDAIKRGEDKTVRMRGKLRYDEDLQKRIVSCIVNGEVP
jgi:hypothetical protein